MIVEIFAGSPEKLKIRLDFLISVPGGSKTINSVIPSHEKGKYILMYV